MPKGFFIGGMMRFSDRPIDTTQKWRYVYIIRLDKVKSTRKEYTTLPSVYYTGQTGNLGKRIYQHLARIGLGYTNTRMRTAFRKLVYVEYIYGTEFDSMEREKQIKGLSKIEKLELIDSNKNMLICFNIDKQIISLKKSNGDGECLIRLTPPVLRVV